MKAAGRPEVKIPGSEPCSEPGDSPQTVVALKADLSARAPEKKWSESSYLPPASVSARLNRGDGPAPAPPLCSLGLPQDTVRESFGAADALAWWDAPFEMGRAPFGSEYCAVWRALFESSAPPERVLAPAYRRLLRARYAVVMGRGDQRRAEEVESVAYQTAPSAPSGRDPRRARRSVAGVRRQDSWLRLRATPVDHVASVREPRDRRPEGIGGRSAAT